MPGLSKTGLKTASETKPGITKRRFIKAGAAAGLAFSLPATVRADAGCDLQLVLSADVSRSVDAQKFKLQRDGYANAIMNPRVVKLMQAGPNKRIALNFVEWSGGGAAAVMVDWAGVGSQAEANDFAAKVREAQRLFMDRTSISTGIDFALAQFAKCPMSSDRRVIDISGDGTHNSGRPLDVARKEAIDKGVTINGIVILSAVPLAFNPAHTHPPGGLLKYFEDNVIGGDGAFALAAEGFEDFGQAIVQKLIKEIAWAQGVSQRA